MKREMIKIEMSIAFEYDEKQIALDHAIETAMSLAIRPIYHTIEDSVQLTNHEITNLF